MKYVRLDGKHLLEKHQIVFKQSREFITNFLQISFITTWTVAPFGHSGGGIHHGFSGIYRSCLMFNLDKKIHLFLTREAVEVIIGECTSKIY